MRDEIVGRGVSTFVDAGQRPRGPSWPGEETGTESLRTSAGSLQTYTCTRETAIQADRRSTVVHAHVAEHISQRPASAKRHTHISDLP